MSDEVERGGSTNLENLGVDAEYSLQSAIVNTTKVANIVTMLCQMKVRQDGNYGLSVLPGSAIYGKSKFP